MCIFFINSHLYLSYSLEIYLLLYLTHINWKIRFNIAIKVMINTTPCQLSKCFRKGYGSLPLSKRFSSTIKMYNADGINAAYDTFLSGITKPSLKIIIKHLYILFLFVTYI